ncbi:MAG: ferrous iron transporter B [Dehalococcoidales bacterium]|nr:ferrous iron transporter B [Dehalococcoidales bacterium]
MKILLMGNPNVGKSVLFSRLTGVQVIASNYPGSTVGYSRGQMKVNGKPAEIIDVPGTYSLDPSSDAERVAVEMLKDGDTIINIVDATNLERNLYLTLQLLEQNIPMIIALNMWDDTKHLGINLDLEKLRVILGVPVIPTVAVAGTGVKTLVEALPLAVKGDSPTRTADERWAAIGQIVTQVQQITHRHHTWREKLADASVKPFSGMFIALAVLAGSFGIIRFIGEGLINHGFNPLFNLLLGPLTQLSHALGGSGLLHEILIGRLVNGQVNFTQSFGLLTTAVYIEFAAVLPYVVAFYLVLGLLEDTGYLPRLAVLMDTLLHRIGLHGYAIIPTMLGLGCNVPAILSTRILESKRERFIAATLISIAVPCAALQAMIWGLVGKAGPQYLAMVYGTLVIVWVLLGFIINKFTRGFSPEMLTEIPPYRIPPWHAVAQKLWMRVKGFILEATPIVLISVLVVGLLYSVGVFDAIARFAAPVVTGLLGLPKEAVTAIVVGFIRKDIAMGMLTPLNLTASQLVISSVVLAMFFPCIATFVILTKELGLKATLRATGIMVIAALSVGGLLHLILR